jgi:hypothetical protein
MAERKVAGKTERLTRKLDAARAQESKRRSQLEAARAFGKKVGKRTKQLEAATALVAGLSSRIKAIPAIARVAGSAADQPTQSTDGHGSARAVVSAPAAEPHSQPPAKRAAAGSRSARTASSPDSATKGASARPASAGRTSRPRTGQRPATRSTPPRRSLRKRDSSEPPANED